MRCVYMSPSVLTGSLHDTIPLEGKFKTFFTHAYMLYMHQVSFLVFFVLFLTVSTLKKQKWRKTPELGTFKTRTSQALVHRLVY